MEVRPARHEDVPEIVEWTRNTFDWGDYVPGRLPEWIDDPSAYPAICVDSGRIIGVGNTAMLSDTEAWLEGARVHPDHQRRGVGSLLNRSGLDWARSRGARVARLATEAANLAAKRQVESIGYRHTSTWAFADLKPLERAPVAGATGLKPAPRADVDAAWLSWVSSELAHGGREMLAVGWRWRRATPDDLPAAVKAGALFQSPAGWLIADQPEPDWMRCGWMSTSREDAPALLEDLLMTAREMGVDEVSLKAPWLPWVVEALTRAGYEPGEIAIYSIGI
jgi:GNAT superfamily N-acetyltransferase